MKIEQITGILEAIGLASQVVVEYSKDGGQVTILRGRFMSAVKVFDLGYSDSAGQIVRNLKACTFETNDSHSVLRLEPSRILSITTRQK